MISEAGLQAIVCSFDLLIDLQLDRPDTDE